MDRHSFLAGLDFLVPSASNEWPARLLCEAGSNRHFVRSSHDQIRIENLHLSIEALALEGDLKAGYNEELTNLGVIFFNFDQTSPDNSDSALSKCSIDFYRSQPNVANTRLDSKLSESKVRSSPRYLSAEDLPVPATACLTLQVNDRVYFLDWTQCTKRQVEAAVAGKPSCLQLFFPSCLFRFFSLTSANTSTAGNDFVNKYRFLLEQMDQIFSVNASPLLPGISLMESPVGSGAGNSAESSSGEAAQNQSKLTISHTDILGDQNTAAAAAAAATLAAVTTVTVTTENAVESSALSLFHSSFGNHHENKRADFVKPRVEGKAGSLKRCHAHLSSLFTLLDLPNESFTGAFAGKGDVTGQQLFGRDFTENVYTVMTNVADDLADSYVQQTDLETMRHRQEEKIGANKRKIEEALNSLFPAPRGGFQQARRRQSQLTQNQIRVENGSSNITKNQLQDLLQNYERSVKERHELLYLPSRGGSIY